MPGKSKPAGGLWRSRTGAENCRADRLRCDHDQRSAVGSDASCTGRIGVVACHGSTFAVSGLAPLLSPERRRPERYRISCFVDDKRTLHFVSKQYHLSPVSKHKVRDIACRPPGRDDGCRRGEDGRHDGVQIVAGIAGDSGINGRSVPVAENRITRYRRPATHSAAHRARRAPPSGPARGPAA